VEHGITQPKTPPGSPTREVNFQQEAIDFSGPKRSLTCARILSGRASFFFAASDRGALLRHADCMV
jgi:hypothetical protein